MPEHRRVLRQGHGDVHDHGRHLHPALPVLRRGTRAAAAARSRGAREPREDDRGVAAPLRRRHERRPRRPARRRRAALRRLHPRGAGALARHADRGAGAGLPRPHGARAGNPRSRAARRDEPQPRDGAAPVPAGASGLRLRPLARAARRVQVTRTRRADQVRPDGGPHLPVARYVHPDTFAMFECEAQAMGFRHAAVGALVRSSYHADRQAEGVLASSGA